MRGVRNFLMRRPIHILSTCVLPIRFATGLVAGSAWSYTIATTTVCAILLACWSNRVALGEPAKEFKEVVGHLRTSDEAAHNEESIENRIRSATWDLMFAELAAERGDEVSLWSEALNRFERGFQALEQIETAIDKDPTLENRISESPQVAMRLDAARVRKTQTEKRQTLARAQERERLNQLREMVRCYRDLTDKMATADLYYRLGSHSLARKTNIEVIQTVSRVYDIAKKRRDFYLFQDEPSVDGNGDFEMVQTIPDPLEVDLIAHMKALQALAACRLATSDPSGGVDKELLKQAQSWANAAVTDEQTGGNGVTVPAGHNPNNPVAHYVLGIANEMIGVETTRVDPSSAQTHIEAKPYFEKAKTHLTKALGLIDERREANDAMTQLVADIRRRQQYMDDTSAYLDEAKKLTAQGRPHQAWQMLQEAALRHRDAKIWMAMIDAGRRGMVPRGELDTTCEQAAESGVLTVENYQAQIVLAKVTLDVAWDRIARNGVPQMTPEERDALLVRLADGMAALQKAAPASGESEAAQSQLDAFRALMIAYQTMLAPAADEVRLREAYRLTQDSEAALRPVLELEAERPNSIELREALIASRLACGHLSILVLPDYRDDGLTAFAAAFDEMAKLPFRQGDLAILGSPLITALTHRPADASAQLAVEERRYRQLVTRFLEGMYTLHFGHAEAAADQMSQALQAADHSGGEMGDIGPRDAGTMLGQADGFDAQVTLQDSVHAFKILADAAAGRHEAALDDAVGLLVPDTSITNVEDIAEPLLQTAVRNIQSPLTGFTLGQAIDSHLTHRQKQGDQRHEMLLSQARAAHARVAQLLESARMQDRYPHLAALNEQSRETLAREDSYVNSATQLRNRGDILGAIDTIAEGLKRHPRSQQLWQLDLEARVEQIRRADASADNYNALLERVAEAANKQMISAYVMNYYNGILYERLGKGQKAIAALEDASSQATTPQQRIRARSKISELRVQLAMAGG